MPGTDKLLAGPVHLYIAAVGTPLVDAALTGIPGSPWTLLGNGWHDDDGVKVAAPQEIEDVYVQNELLPIDAFRKRATLMIEAMLQDMQADAFAWAYHGDSAQVTTRAASATEIGKVEVPLERGFEIHKFALLCKGRAPYADGEGMVFYFPRGYASGDYESTMMLATPAKVPFKFMALKHETLTASWQAQTAPTT